MKSKDIKARMLVAEAKRWIGIQEQGGDNQGQMVKKFQKAVDGKAYGEPWCLSMVMFCIKAVDSLCQESMYWRSRAKVKNTEHCLTLWNALPKSQRHSKPKVGRLVIWQHYRNGKPTSSGHVGVVTKVIDGKYIMTVEGNTGSTTRVERNGDGVFEKRRTIKGSRRMKVKGFADVWV